MSRECRLTASNPSCRPERRGWRQSQSEEEHPEGSTAHYCTVPGQVPDKGVADNSPVMP